MAELTVLFLVTLSEQFSIKYRKTKVVNLTNHKLKGIDNPVNQSKLEARKGCVRKLRLVLVLLVIGSKSGVGFLNQSLSIVMQNQNKCELLSTLSENCSIKQIWHK